MGKEVEQVEEKDIFGMGGEESKVEERKKKKKAEVKVQKFPDLEGKFLLVKVGNTEHAASPEQIEDVRNNLTILFEKNNINCITFVTHHAVAMEVIERKKK